MADKYASANLPSKQIWKLTGPWWQIPLKVKPLNETICEVRPGGIPLLDSQREMAERTLQALGQRHGCRFLMAMAALETVATRSDKSPEELLVWHPPEAMPDEPALKFVRQETNDFINAWFEKYACRRLRNTAEAVYLYNSFCTHMLDWLVNRNEPVDLLFCRLHPQPFRSYWKNITFELDVTKDHEWFQNGEVHRGHPCRVRNLPIPVERISWCIFNAKNVRMCRWSGRMDWTLDVELMPLWEETTRQLETNRHKLYPKWKDYWYSVMDVILRRLSDSLRLYEKFYREIFEPFPEIHWHYDKSVERVVLAVKTEENGKVVYKTLYPGSVPASLDPRSNPQGRCGNVASKAAVLREMRALQSKSKNMRKPKRPKTEGVPVHNAPSGVEPG